MTEEELAKHDSKTLLQLLLSADARCDALTAERDEWKTRHFTMRDKHDARDIAAKNYAAFSNEWRKRAEAAEAERDRLRKYLEAVIDEYNGHMYGPTMHTIEAARNGVDW